MPRKNTYFSLLEFFFFKKIKNSFECSVAAHSAQNNMNVENLAIVVGPNILKTPEITTGGNVHKTYQRIFKVVELMIRHVDVVFTGVGEQRRALLEAAKDEAMREARCTRPAVQYGFFILIFFCLFVYYFVAAIAICECAQANCARPHGH